MNQPDFGSVDTIVHVIQASLSPIFLLSALASLLSVFMARLARISDQAERQAKAIGASGSNETRRVLGLLKLRSHALDTAVALAAVAGVCTCGTVLTLFLTPGN